MQYDFDSIIDRRQFQASKYDELENVFGAKDIISLWVADMDFRTAQPIIDAVKKKADHGIFGYTSKPESYNRAFYDWQVRRNGYKPELSLIENSSGVVPSIIYFIRTLTQKGDSILIQTPVYSQFIKPIKTWERKMVTNILIQDENKKYNIDFDDFEKQIIDNKVKMFILCNPHNPIGRIWTLEELTKMAEICIRHKVIIISDEIHSDLILKGKHIVMASISKEISDNTISLFSSTKTFNLAGLQASTIVFNNNKNLEDYKKYCNMTGSDGNGAFSIMAIETAFREGDEWLEQLLDYLRGNASYIKDFLDKNIPQIKANDVEATYLMWLDCRAMGLNDEELKDFFINKAKLALNSGYTFGAGGEGFMRLNFACSRKVLENAMNNLYLARTNA